MAEFPRACGPVTADTVLPHSSSTSSAIFAPSSVMLSEPWAGGVCDRHPCTGKYTKNTFSCIFPSVSSYQPPHEETCLLRTGKGFEMTYLEGTLIQCPFSKIISTRISPGACAPQPWGLGQRTQILNFLFLSFFGGAGSGRGQSFPGKY